MENVIRKLTVNNSIPFINEEGQHTGILLPLILIVGVMHTIYLESENLRVKRRICEIVKTQDHFLIYLENESESQLWKKIPITKDCTEEFKID